MFIALVISTAVLALICLSSASMKLRKHPQAVAVIGNIVGVPVRYFSVLAALEIAGAAALTEVVGREAVYKPVTPEEHQQILRSAGTPDDLAAMAVAVDAGIRAGAFAYQNGDLSRLIGRPTTPLLDGLRPLV